MKKLSDEQIIAIHRDTRSVDKICVDYGIHQTTVLQIKRGVHRKDLKLGMTKHYREVQADKILGKRPPRPQKSITALEILEEEQDPDWIKVKREARERRDFYAAYPTP